MLERARPIVREPTTPRLRPVILDSDDPAFHASPSEAGPRPYTFSLAILFRVVTLVCVFLGWVALVANVAPWKVGLIVLAGGIILGAVVGVRRRGSVLRQIIAAAFFWVGTVWVAVYSGTLAAAIQAEDNPATPWDESGETLTGGAMCLFPFVLGLVVLMLRAWTWSAHDATIHRDH
jgi:hypothetical protein